MESECKCARVRTVRHHPKPLTGVAVSTLGQARPAPSLPAFFPNLEAAEPLTARAVCLLPCLFCLLSATPVQAGALLVRLQGHRGTGPDGCQSRLLW